MPEVEKIIAIANILNVSLDVLLRDEYAIDDVLPFGCASQEPEPESVVLDGSSNRTAMDVHPDKKTRFKKVAVGACGVFALLLAAVLVIGTRIVPQGDISRPSVSTSNSEQTVGHLPNKEQLQKHIQLRRYMRGVIKHVKGQVGRIEEDIDYVQTP